MAVIVWMLLVLYCALHCVSGHNYAVACRTSLVLSGHRSYQYQTVLGSGQVKLRRNQDVLRCGSELITGEVLEIDVQNTVSGGDDLIEVLGGASFMTKGSRCRKTRAFSSKAVVFVNNLKGYVTIQLAYGGLNRGEVYHSPICKYTIKTGANPISPENQSAACPPPRARIGGLCQCPIAHCALAYGERCEGSFPCVDSWNGTAAPTLIGRSSAALLRLDTQAVLDPTRPLSVQLTNYNISAPAQQGALGLGAPGLSAPVSLMAEILPTGLLFQAGLASLALAYDPRLVTNASALLALRFNAPASAWEPAAAAHDAAAGILLLPLTESGRYAVFDPTPASARPPDGGAAPPPPPAPARLYAEASLAVLALSGAFAFLHAGVSLLAHVLEPAESDPGKARGERTATAEIVVDNSRRHWA